MLLRYPLDLSPDDNDTLMVSCPDLPEVNSFGETEAEALAMGRAAVTVAVAGRLAHSEDVPRPSEGPHPVALDLQTTLKVLLYWTLTEQGRTRADLARLMGKHREQVDRLFDPRHATRLDQYEAAFAALGRTVEVQVAAA